MKLKAALFLFFFSALLCSAAFADINETAAGAIISADAYQIKLNYTDAVQTLKPTVYGTTIETTVAPMYGWDQLANLPDLNYTSPGQPVTYFYVSTNKFECFK